MRSLVIALAGTGSEVSWGSCKNSSSSPTSVLWLLELHCPGHGKGCWVWPTDFWCETEQQQPVDDNTWLAVRVVGGADSQYDIPIQLTPPAHTDTYTPDKNPPVRKKSNKWMNLRNDKISNRHSCRSQYDIDNLFSDGLHRTCQQVPSPSHHFSQISWDLKHTLLLFLVGIWIDKTK